MIRPVGFWMFSGVDKCCLHAKIWDHIVGVQCKLLKSIQFSKPESEVFWCLDPFFCPKMNDTALKGPI